MNALSSKQFSVDGSRRISVLAGCMALLLISIRLAHGDTGYTLMSGVSNAVFNVYAYDGNSGMSDGVDPVGMFNGSPAGGGYGFLPPPYQDAIPQVGNQVVITPVIPIVSGASSGVTFRFGNPKITGGGTQTYDNCEPTGTKGTTTSLTMLLYNPNTAADEIRLDWYAFYSYAGTQTTLASSPFLANVQGSFSGTYSNFYALAGGETITDGSSSTTATIGNGFAPFGLSGGPWTGTAVYGTSTFATLLTAPFSVPAGLTVNNGDIIFVQGYLDLVVDPGTVQVQLAAIVPPQLGITTYNNSPVVYYPTVSGLNFNLQTAPDLSGSNWMTVSNGIPISGFIITNATSPAFFRLN